jgi:hypothetical protein
MSDNSKAKRSNRKKKSSASTEDLWAEFKDLLKAASQYKPSPKKSQTKSAVTPARRLKILERALAKSDLARIREEVPDEDTGNDVQKVFVYAYACILETNSAGLSILFDRFTQRERRKIASALEAIGVGKALRDLRGLERAFAQARSRGKSAAQSAEWLSQRPATAQIDRQSARHVSEMETKLLRYCSTHLDELAGSE